MTTEVVIMRHGQPDYPPGVYPDPFQMDLSPLGVRQARLAREFVARFNPDKVYSSDFLRAKRTASVALEGLNLGFSMVSELRERTFHALAGTPFEALPARLGPDKSQLIAAGNSDEVDLEGEESYDQARARVVEFVLDLEQAPHGRVLLVAHGGPHGWLVEEALKLSLRGVRSLRWDMACFSRFTLENGSLTLRYVNRTAADTPD